MTPRAAADAERHGVPFSREPAVLLGRGVRQRFATLAWGVGLVFLALLQGERVSGQQSFSGLIVTRRIEVDSNALVALLGREAGNPERVFSLPAERLVRWADERREGVKVEETTTRVRRGRVRVDVKSSSGNSFVLADASGNSLYWVHPQHRSVAVWEKPRGLDRRTPAPLPPLLPLGKNAPVAGLEAEGYKMVRGSESAWVWVARKPEPLAKLAQSFLQLSRAIKPEAETLDQMALRAASPLGFPVRVQVMTPARYLLVEVVRWEEREQPEADFEIPREYQRRTVSELQGEPAGP